MRQPGQRLDQWLDVACLFKTRSQAQSACKAGKVELNGVRAKPHREVRPGDHLRITRGGYKQILEVRELADNHLPKAQARQLYADQTPPPTPEELELRRLAREAGIRPAPKPRGAPSKRDRRLLRRLKHRQQEEG